MAMGEPGADRSVLTLQDVVDEELSVYLDERRAQNKLPSVSPKAPLWGLCLSGGGIRSATFCLGVLQSLMARGLLKRFDYLSTVSGGGYIGSCLSSIFAGESRGDEELGLDGQSSPFVGLRKDAVNLPAGETRLCVRHQMHHLRSHGEYLIPRAGILHRDFQRFLGAGGLGIFYTLMVFALALVLAMSLLHLTFSALDPTLEALSSTNELVVAPAPASSGFVSKWTSYLTGVASAWWAQRFVTPLATMLSSASRHPLDLATFAIIGVVWSVGWVLYLRGLAKGVAGIRRKILDKTRAGWTSAEMRHFRVARRYNLWSIVLAVVLTLAVSIFRSSREGTYLAAFWLPFSFSCGAWVAAFLAIGVGETLRDVRNKAGRSAAPGVEAWSQARRSLYDTIGGANLLGMIASLLVPVASVLVFSLARLPNKFLLASVVAIGAWWVTRGRKMVAIDQRRFLGPALDGAVLFFLVLAASSVSELLLKSHRANFESIALGAGVALASAILLLGLVGYAFDPNRISPHHFYSDRLAEAYLRTDARVVADRGERHLPLATIRDDEQLELRSLAKPSKAPLHLIVAALNLADSDELVRKRMKSDHFVFSGLHVGSRTTGFVPTEKYRDGRTRLATAVATSAAAVASAAGLNTRRSIAFLATLFNGRLGLWLENPGRYSGGRNPTRPLTFWPSRLLQEILGGVRGDGRLVNVSDGGHTGDNLGLLPLLQRRCKVIVVCDAEADPDLDFGSFGNVVRMANVELNARIEIDLGPVQRRLESPEGFLLSEASVLTGTITYGDEEQESEPTRLIYIKSSVSKDGESARASGLPTSADDARPATRDERNGGMLPAAVASYLRSHSGFPHQTTADQFFDDGQFEAYRALGESLGERAACLLAPHREPTIAA